MHTFDISKEGGGVDYVQMKSPFFLTKNCIKVTETQWFFFVNSNIELSVSMCSEDGCCACKEM